MTMMTVRKASARLGVGAMVLAITGGVHVRAIPPDWEAAPASRQTATYDRAHRAADPPGATPRTNGDGVPPPVVDVGADTCNAVTVVPLPVGPPGNPSRVVIIGDNTPATGPECDPTLGTTWWEAFEIDTCAKVTLRLCGSVPRNFPSHLLVTDFCAADGTTCGPFFEPDSWTRGICGDGNMWMQFNALAPGTYYYPVFSDETDPNFEGRGPYFVTIDAEACTGSCAGCAGACCDLAADTCTGGLPRTQCMAADQAWHRGMECCSVVCRPPVAEFDSDNVELLSWIPIEQFPGGPHTGNEMWGYVSPSGREYALIGFTTGTGFVDVTDPRNPVIVGIVDGRVDTVWRDMAAFAEHAYVVTDGTGVGLQIVDLSAIDGGLVTLVSESDLGVGFETAHNVFVNEDSGFLYLALSNLNSREGLVAFDLSDPVNPSIAGSWTDSSPSVRCHDLQVVSYTSGPAAGKEIAFCFAENDGLKIADVTDKSAMVTLSTLQYSNTTYTHQGWQSEDRRFLFIDDELDEISNPNVTLTTTYVVDVQDLSAPFLRTTFGSGLCTIDHNLMVRGNRVYQANYSSGLRVFDVGDIANVAPAGFFDTHPEDNVASFAGAWGVFTLPSGTVLVSDRQRGLFVLCDNPGGPLANLAIRPSPARCGDVVTLDASGSTLCDRTRTIVSYEWDVDFDGVAFDVDLVSAAPTVTTSYSTFGTFFVGLRVTDSLGVQHVTRLDVEVGGNSAPTADAGGPYMTVEGDDLVLDASLSVDPDGACGDAIVEYAWDLTGDGSFTDGVGGTAVLTVPAAQVAALGLPFSSANPIAVRVTDGQGLAATATTTLLISPVGACCFSGGAVCDVRSETSCVAAAGSFVARGAACSGDADGNGLVDVCECFTPPAPTAAACCADTGNGSNVRYLSLVASGAGTLHAIRVTFRDLPPPSDTLNGSVMWLAAPVEVSELAGEVAPAAGFATLMAATLSCQPVAADFGAAGVIHVFHEAIVPGGLYELQAIGETCNPGDEAQFSSALSLRTSRWGDVAGAFDVAASAWPSPDGIVGVTSDAIAVLDKFVNRAGAPIKARVDLEPARPDQIITISDVVAVVDAFRGRPFPSAPAVPCGLNVDCTPPSCRSIIRLERTKRVGQ